MFVKLSLSQVPTSVEIIKHDAKGILKFQNREDKILVRYLASDKKSVSTHACPGSRHVNRDGLVTA